MDEELGKHVLHVLDLLLDDVKTDVDRDDAEMVVDEFCRHGYCYQVQVKVTRNEKDFLQL